MLPVYFPDARHPERMLLDLERFLDDCEERHRALKLDRDVIRSIVLVVHDWLWNIIIRSDIAGLPAASEIRRAAVGCPWTTAHELPAAIDRALGALAHHQAERRAQVRDVARSVFRGIVDTTLRELSYRGLRPVHRATRRFDEAYPPLEKESNVLRRVRFRSEDSEERQQDAGEHDTPAA